MNKTAIKNFAVWARNKLIADISYRAGLIGITESGIASALPQSTGTTEFYDIGTAEPYVISGDEVRQRRRLVELIERKEKETDYETAYKYIIEEVAYTWFNRLIAIRFMEVNDYLPSHIRVLSSESGKLEPDLVTTPFDADLEFSQAEERLIIQYKSENKLDDLFRMLFMKQCNVLNESLPVLFEKTNDYTELLFNASVIDYDGIIYHLVHDIAEDDFNIENEGQVEIIGWLYQYYISEKHDQIINLNKGTVSKEDIPAATQLFTTDWVVRYMVDNSLGRYWIERHPESTLAQKLDFFVTPKDGKIEYINEKIEPEELTFFDPCMGSGHILVYAFDVLMEIYRESGYSDRDAALNIVQNNLYGLDIDKRAYQLAYFAVMMKARSYNRRVLQKCVLNNLSYIEESNYISKFFCKGLTYDEEQNNIGEYLIGAFRDAQEIGSLQTIKKADYNLFAEYLLNIDKSAEQLDIYSATWLNDILPKMLQFAKQAFIMSQKYAIVCTNPPYMGKLDNRLKEFVVNNYKAYSGDLFSVFMYRNFDYCKPEGYSAFMTPFVWMFIKTYEELRKYIIENKAIITLVQMEYSAYEEATVPICSFVLKNAKNVDQSLCFRLSAFKGGMEIQKKKVLEALANKECGYFYQIDGSDYSKIPGSPIAYWASSNVHNAFLNGKEFTGDTKKGVLTGNNDMFLRLWHEVDRYKTGYSMKNHNEMVTSGMKWFPVTSGGFMRKWYGNFDTVVNLENDGFDIRTTVKNYRLRENTYYFREAVTWTEVSSGMFSCRYVPEGILFGNGGPVSFFFNEYLQYTLGFLNSKVVMEIMGYLAPTINYGPEQVKKLPIIIENQEKVEDLVEHNITISRADWDSSETSWDFKMHPLVALRLNGAYAWGDNNPMMKLSAVYKSWEILCEDRFEQLKRNEEELNRIFIDIYGLQNELDSEVDEKNVTVRKADKQRDIKSLLSYAVGCMFGRYSLDHEGLAYAGGEWDDSKFETFIPDTDNCIPLTDEEYFEDDIVGLFCAWIKNVYGENTLEDNLDFIASALGNKGNTNREIIRNYFLNDFIKDHMKIYQKRPIYWMFDSGKQNGFKALIYMHRWNADTIGTLRIDYLHRMQRIYESEINRMQDMIDNSTNAREVATATKRREKLQKQLKECREYDEKIGHLALSRIDIDLDDGVKVNYEKVQTASDGKKYQVLAKI